MRRVTMLRTGTLVALAIVVHSAEAPAQIAPGYSGHSTIRTFGSEVAWQALSAFGSCYASARTSNALELLATRVGTREEVQTYKRLFRKADQGCLGDVTQLNVPYQLVRGAIAEGLYKKNIPVPAHLASSGPLDATKVRDLSDAARCYTAANAASVRSLILETRLGTKQEAAAINAMLPGLAKCVPPGATKRLEVNHMVIRARLAEALWRTTAMSSARTEAN